MTELSPAALAATTAVPLAPDQRHVWFQVLCTTDPEAGEDLAAAAASAGVTATVVEDFLRVLETVPDPAATLAELREAGPDALEAAYLTASAEPVGEAAVEVDEAAWTEFLHAKGARWDREETSWPAFREWFLYEAAQQGLGEPAAMFVEYAESRDKAQTFAEYQIPHAVPESTVEHEPAVQDVSQFPEVKEGDQGDWVAYAEAMLTRAGY